MWGIIELHSKIHPTGKAPSFFAGTISFEHPVDRVRLHIAVEYYIRARGCCDAGTQAVSAWLKIPGLDALRAGGLDVQLCDAYAFAVAGRQTFLA